MQKYAMSDCIENTKTKETYVAVSDVASANHQLERTWGMSHDKKQCNLKTNGGEG